jgi:hypothetical protein
MRRDGFLSNSMNPKFEVESMQIVDKATKMLEEGKPHQEVLDFLAKERGRLNPYRQEVGPYFGKPRKVNMVTPIVVPKYSHGYGIRAIELVLSANPPKIRASRELNNPLNKVIVNAIITGTTVKDIMERTDLTLPDFERSLGRKVSPTDKLSNADKKRLLQECTRINARYVSLVYPYDFKTTTPDGKNINLTKIHFNNGNPVWRHTIPSQAEKVMTEIVPGLVNTIRDPTTGPQDTLRALADLHWHLSHAMPYERGSATITDWFVDSLARSRGIHLSAYRTDVMPDLEALTTERERFIKNYPDFFEHPPEFSGQSSH